MFGGKPASAQEAGPPSGDNIQPEFVAGYPSCSSLGLGDFELKVEPVADGTHSDGTLTVNVDVRDTTAGPVFNWTSDLGVDAVIVKGGAKRRLVRVRPSAGGHGRHRSARSGKPV